MNPTGSKTFWFTLYPIITVWFQYQRDCLIFWEDYLHPQRSLKAPRKPKHKLRHLFHGGHIEPQSVIVLKSNSGRNSSHWKTHICHDIRPSSYQVDAIVINTFSALSCTVLT